MSEESDKEGREHEASEKKVADALEKGDTPRSRDVSLLGSLLGIQIALVVLDRVAAREIGSRLSILFDQSSDIRLRNGGDVEALLQAVVGAIGNALYLAALALIGISVAIGAGPQRPRIVWRRIQVDWSRLSLGAGAKRIFAFEGIREFAKSLGKIAVAVAAVGWSMRFVFVQASVHMQDEPLGAAIGALQLIERLSQSICLVVLIFAIADIVLSHIAWKKRLRMTRQEVVDERKQAEGDPLLKMRMRSLALDRARRRMLSDVGSATMVVANPTHFAVALRYLPGEDAAPVVVAKGQELLALKIREQAVARQIPVVEQPALARGLFRSVELGQIIPPEFYRAVAEIINFLSARDSVQPLSDDARQTQARAR